MLPAEQRPPSHRCGKTQVVYTEVEQHLTAEVFKLCVFGIISSQSSVTLDDVFSFLADFRADESLCRGTQIWNQVSSVKKKKKKPREKH